MNAEAIALEINGRDLEVAEDLGEHGAIVQCQDCLVREGLDAEDDPDEWLGMTLPENCHIEWLREPDGGFRGIALRNAKGFGGRELIAVRGESRKVTDTVRVYDGDAPLLATILGLGEWDRRGGPS